ncbi:MAG: hypothetical protein ABJE80_08110 [Reichenbachiella sp.]|uniref:hypothetical protein n=1 Tax=Reichenbachiella sp. TaxID=2184521 RepID=UPI0032651ED8
MPDWLVMVIVIVGFVLAVGLLFWWLVQKSLRRTAAIQTIAADRGWVFKEDENPDLIRKRFQSIPIFNKGNSYTCSNLMLGKIDDFEIWVCDYLYWGHAKQTHGGREVSVSSSQKQRQTVICLRYPEANLPTFDITLNLGLAKLTEYDPKNAIVLAGALDFSKKYMVCVAEDADKEVVTRLFTEEIQSLFPTDAKLKVQVSGNEMMITNYSLEIKATELEGYIHTVLSIGKSLNG